MTDDTMKLFDDCMRLSGATVLERAQAATVFHQALASGFVGLDESRVLMELNPYLTGMVITGRPTTPMSALRQMMADPGGIAVEEFTRPMFLHREMIETSAAALSLSFQERDLAGPVDGMRVPVMTEVTEELRAAWKFIHRITGRSTQAVNSPTG